MRNCILLHTCLCCNACPFHWYVPIFESGGTPLSGSPDNHIVINWTNVIDGIFPIFRKHVETPTIYVPSWTIRTMDSLCFSTNIASSWISYPWLPPPLVLLSFELFGFALTQTP